MSKSVKITFQPEGRVVYVLPGTAMVEAAGEAGVVINSPCGGKGTCGKCRVEIARGAPEPTPADRKHLSLDDLERGVRLACQTRIEHEMVVTVPADSRFFEQRILRAAEGPRVEIEPAVRSVRLRLSPPSLEDNRADSDRLLEALEAHRKPPENACRLAVPLRVARKLPAAIRRDHDAVVVIYSEDEVLDLLPGEEMGETYGVAFDIGTTTIVGMLVSLEQPRPARTAARTNPQVRFGDDVVSRIEHAQSSPDGLRELQACVVDCLNEIVGELCAQGGIRRRNILEAVVAGNTTMAHLLLGIDPSSLARAPYVPPLRSEMRFDAAEIGLRLNPAAKLFTVPNIAGFVGGDTVAVALATGLRDADGVRLAIDIGTNGELVLAKDGRLLACSTAAGPAFEGARITFGMRAANGAIEKVVIDDDVRIGVIGDVPARGLCGSSIVDAVAELLRVGVVNATGRMLPPEQLPASVPPLVARRVVHGEAGVRFVLAHEEETQIDGPVYLTQRDVREVQLAKGAVAAGYRLLLEEAGIAPEDLSEVLLAGAFGNYIRRSRAKRIGLLPDIPTDRITFVGNAAGAGARMVLLSQRCREQAERISRETEYIELCGRPDFQAAFADAMLFPES